MKNQLLFFLLLVSCFAQAKDTTDISLNEGSVAGSEGLPSNFVNNCVCAITGEFVDYELDAMVPGPEPLLLQRSYSSASTTNYFGQAWSINHRSVIALNTYQNTETRTWFTYLLQPSSGAQLLYKHKYKLKDKHEKLSEILFDLDIPKGMTNGSSSEISGRTNLKNQKLYLYPKKEEIIVISPNGDKGFFKQIRQKSMHQIRDEKVSGYHVLYEHIDDTSIVKNIRVINPVNKLVTASLNFVKKPKEKNLVLEICTSHGKQINYFFHTHKYSTKEQQGGHKVKTTHGDDYLIKVVNTGRPEINYEYEPKDLDENHLHIKRKKVGSKQFQNVSYYKKGQSNLNGLGKINISDKEDFRLDRVKTLSAPVGHDSTPITTHYFLYFANEKKKDGVKKILDGRTEVYDKDLHKVTYHYDKYQRLIALEKFIGGFGNYHSYCKESYLWGARKTDQEGNLIGKYLTDSAGKIISGNFFYYHENGNIYSEQLFGCLTGKPAPEIRIGPNQYPEANGCECYIKTKKYNALHLPIYIEESNGTIMVQGYKEGTNLPTFQFIYKDNQLRGRTFYQYDSNGVVTRVIKDNGTAIYENSYEGITERHITQHYLIQKAPYNLPERTDELCLDAASNEVLIQRTLFEYYDDGRMKRKTVCDDQGQPVYALYWEYDAHGNVTKEINAIGEITERAYDENDNLLFQNEIHRHITTSFEYDHCNRLISRTEKNPDGTFVNHYAYDFKGNKILDIDPQGNETRYTYDELGRLIQAELPEVLNESQSLSKQKNKKYYDVLGYVTCEEDAKGLQTHFQRNVRGQPIRVSYPDGTQEAFIYHLDGKLAQKTEKNGKVINYENDYAGRVTKEQQVANNEIKTTVYNYNLFNLNSSIDCDQLETKYTYDCRGRLIATLKGDQNVKQSYDTLGRVSEIREWYGENPNNVRINKKKYDILNHVIEDRIEDHEGKTLSLALYKYDARGNCIFKQVGEVAITTSYNTFNQPVLITDGLNNNTHFSYNYFYFDPSQNKKVLQTIITDSLGHLTIQVCDSLGRIVEIEKRNPFGVTLSSEKMCYDLNGNRTKTTHQVYHNGNPTRTICTLRKHNQANQIVELIEAVNTPDQRITKYVYNPCGQLTATIKPDGTILHSHFDGYGRLKEFYDSKGFFHYVYAYTISDLPTKVTDLKTNTSTERRYDRMGQMIHERLANGLTLGYSYDKVGRPTLLTLPDESAVKYVCNGTELKEIHRIKNNEIAYSHFESAHNLSGAVLEAQTIGNETTHYSYDPLGRLVNLKGPSIEQNVPKNGYDQAGNLLHYTTDETNHTYTYDDLYQLSSENGHASHTYQHDSVSSRLEKDGEACQVNALNQVLSQGTEKYTYTQNGNIATRTTSDGSLTKYLYDSLDRLIQVQIEDRSINYHYDSFNRRIKKSEEGKIDQCFFYQGLQEIGKCEDGVIKELKLMKPDKNHSSIAVELNQEVYVPIQDLFGNVIQLKSLSGNILEEYSYTAFGEETILDCNEHPIQQSHLSNPWRYANKRTDEETGFVVFGLRYYHPLTGQWITPDPLGDADGPNLYAYVHASPLVYFDALGLMGDSFLGFKPLGGGVLEHPNFELPPGLFGLLDVRRTWTTQDGSFWDEKAENYNLMRDFADPATGKKFNLKNDRNHRVIGVFGIDTSLPNFNSNLIYCKDLSQGHNIYGTHSPTRDTFRDAYRYVMTTFGNVAFQAVIKLHQQLDDFFSKADADASPLICCHSWGSAIVNVALKSYPPELRKRIQVLSLAPGGYIDRDLCKDVIHYASHQDLVPRLDVMGRKRAIEQGTLNMVGDASKSTLSNLVGFAIGDGGHSFQNPDYAKPIKDTFYNYFNNGSMRP